MEVGAENPLLPPLSAEGPLLPPPVPPPPPPLLLLLLLPPPPPPPLLLPPPLLFGTLETMEPGGAKMLFWFGAVDPAFAFALDVEPEEEPEEEEEEGLEEVAPVLAVELPLNDDRVLLFPGTAELMFPVSLS